MSSSRNQEGKVPARIISVIDTVLWEEKDWERLAQWGCVLRHEGTPSTGEEVIRRINGAQIVVVAEARISAEVIESCPKLEMISLWSTGYDHVNMEAARHHSIVVCNVPNYAAHSVAEHAMAMALALAKKLSQADKHVRSGLFSWQAIRGMELYGKTVGVVGTGSIGGKFAALAHGFGCRVLATTLHPSPERASRLGVEYVDLVTLLKESDIISLHVPLTSATEKMLGRAEFEFMQKQPILINTARGGVIDHDALVWALEEGKIQGAGLDVLWGEPPCPDDPLFQKLLAMDNVILSPHCGSNTPEAFRRLTDTCLDNIAHYLAGQPTNVVT
jgi:phosphoglycerate dehydrogenase-like enzyme